jgi:hypothetical protein
MEVNPLHFLENRDDVLALSTNIIQLEDQVKTCKNLKKNPSLFETWKLTVINCRNQSCDVEIALKLISLVLSSCS